MKIWYISKIRSFSANLLHFDHNSSGFGHKIKEIEDLEEKKWRWRNGYFFRFFGISVVLWLLGSPRVTKLVTRGSHGWKHKLGWYSNWIRKFQPICCYFDFCVLSRHSQNEPYVHSCHGIMEERWKNITMQISRRGGRKRAKSHLPNDG